MNLGDMPSLEQRCCVTY